MHCRHFRGPPSALPACQGESTPVAWFCGRSPGRWKTWQRAWLWNPEGHGLRRHARWHCPPARVFLGVGAAVEDVSACSARLKD